MPQIVPDPYRPDTIDGELARLQRAREQVSMASVAAGFGKTVGVFVVLSAVALALGAFMDFFAPMATASGCGLGLLLGFFSAAFYRVASRDARLRELEAVPVSVEVPVAVVVPFRKLSQDLRALPREQREELRSLWDNSLEAAKILEEMPGTPEARELIWRRQSAVAKVKQEWLALQAAEQADARALAAREAEARQADAVAKLTSAASDLELAEAHREGLAEGRRAYQKLTQELTS